MAEGRHRKEFEELASFSSHSAYKKKQKLIRGRSGWLKGLAALLCVLVILLGVALIFIGTYYFEGFSVVRLPWEERELQIAGRQEPPELSETLAPG